MSLAFRWSTILSSIQRDAGAFLACWVISIVEPSFAVSFVKVALIGFLANMGLKVLRPILGSVHSEHLTLSAAWPSLITLLGVWVVLLGHWSPDVSRDMSNALHCATSWCMSHPAQLILQLVYSLLGFHVLCRVAHMAGQGARKVVGGGSRLDLVAVHALFLWAVGSKQHFSPFFHPLLDAGHLAPELTRSKTAASLSFFGSLVGAQPASSGAAAALASRLLPVFHLIVLASFIAGAAHVSFSPLPSAWTPTFLAAASPEAFLSKTEDATDFLADYGGSLMFLSCLGYPALRLHELLGWLRQHHTAS